MLKLIDTSPMWWTPLLRNKVNRTEDQLCPFPTIKLYCHIKMSHMIKLKKVLPKEGIRIEWDDTANFTQSKFI